MMDSHPLVLGLRSAGLQGVDPSNVDEMHDIWNAFSKAKNCIDGGYRYEYLSWRIYSRELLRLKNSTSPDIVSQDELNPMSDISYQESSDSDSNTDSDYLGDSMIDSRSSFSGSPTHSSTKPTCSTNSGNCKGDTSKQIRPKKEQPTSSHSTSCLDLNPIHPMRRISSIELEHMFNGPPVRDGYSEKDKYALKETTDLSRRVQNMGKENERVGLTEENGVDAKIVTVSRNPPSESKRTHNKIGFDPVHNDRANTIYLRRSRFNRSRARFQSFSRESKRFSDIQQPDTVKKSHKASIPHRFTSADGREVNPRDISQAEFDQIEVNKGGLLDTHSEVSAKNTSRRGSLEETINASNMQKENLPIIRGFDTSQISVSVNRRSVPDIQDELEAAHAVYKGTEKSELENDTEAKIRESSIQHSNNSDIPKLHDEKQPRHNMFFIGAAESDSEVSPLNSPTSNNVSASTGPRNFSRVEKTASGTEEDWDDISVDEGDESVDEGDQSEKNEDHLKSLFTERDVPASPGLKRSLLSSMFLSKMEQNNRKQNNHSDLDDTNADNKVIEEPLKTDPANVNCSVDNSSKKGSSLLYDGNCIDMIPKFRMRASPQTVASMSTTKWQGGRSTCDDHEKHKINHRYRQPLTRACSQSSGLGVSQSKSPLGSQTNITARPEIFRASSTTRVDALSNHDSTSKMDWSNLHEDIYDPMNYHSRGW